MDLNLVFLAIHLVGLALGLGGATISDILFFRAIKDKDVDPSEYSTLKVLSKVIWVGLILLIASGLGMFYLIYRQNSGSLPLLSSPRWQAKLTLVGIVLANGFVFLSYVFPALGNIGLSLTKFKLWLLAASGTVSIVSWYGILVVSILPRTFRLPYLYFMGAYLAVVIMGVIFARIVLGRRLAR